MLNQLILFVNKHENISEYSSQTIKTVFQTLLINFVLNIKLFVHHFNFAMMTMTSRESTWSKTLSYITQCQKPTNSHIVLPRHNLSSLYLHQSPTWVLTFQFGRKLASDKTALQGTLCRPWRWMFCDDWFHEFFRK